MRDSNLSRIFSLGLLSALLFFIFSRASEIDNTFAFYVASISAVIGTLTAIVLIVMSIESFVYTLLDWDTRIRLNRSITPNLEIIKAAGHLSEAQARVVPNLNWGEEIGVIPGDKGPHYVLHTPGGFIPIEFVKEILQASNTVGLQAQREISEGTPMYEYRRLFGNWLVYSNPPLGIEATGPYTVRWITADSRRLAAIRIGLDPNDIFGIEV